MRWGALLLALCVSRAAFADELGAKCEATSQCGGLHCVDGLCSAIVGNHAFAPVQRRTSAGMIAGGFALVFAGLGTGGGAAFLTGFALTSHACADFGCEPPPYALLGVAIPLDVIALASFVGGVVMIALGARGFPVDEKVAFGPGGLRFAW